ncbi:MAG: PAS domain-containing protein [Actinomycetota bacterium]
MATGEPPELPERRSPAELGDPAESERRYRLLVEHLPAIIYMDEVDEYSTNIYTSPQIGQILGIPREEWVTDRELWVKQMHPDDRDRVLRENDESNRTGAPFRSEYRMITRDGRELWFRDEAAVVRDENGDPWFWRGVMTDITEIKRTEQKLTESLEILKRTIEQRRALLSRLEQAQEQERRRIAADIHDDSIQVISAVDMRLQMLERQVESPEAAAAISEIKDTVQLAIDRLRHLLFELRPPVLDREGLAPALEIYLERMAAETGVAVELVDQASKEPPPDLRAIAFRIVQEALSNIRKHANASHVVVTLSGSDAGLSVRITDDGVGFDRAQPDVAEPGHLGLSTMRERAELAGGSFVIDSAPGSGTTVEFRLPFSTQPAAAQSSRT